MSWLRKPFATAFLYDVTNLDLYTSCCLHLPPRKLIRSIISSGIMADRHLGQACQLVPGRRRISGWSEGRGVYRNTWRNPDLRHSMAQGEAITTISQASTKRTRQRTKYIRPNLAVDALVSSALRSRSPQNTTFERRSNSGRSSFSRQRHNAQT